MDDEYEKKRSPVLPERHRSFIEKNLDAAGFSNVWYLWNFCFKMTGCLPNEIRSEKSNLSSKNTNIF
jgi:hypothetical protein